MNEWTVLREGDWEQLLREVEEGDEVYISSGDEPVAVLISVERWDELNAALTRLGAPTGNPTEDDQQGDPHGP